MAEIIVTLEAQKGRKYDETGQAIASYGRSIVFLPKGVQPGQKVRVRLIEIPGKRDVRGWPMYRAEPAPIEYVERWKDNGDGTVSRVKLAINWLGEQREIETIERRKLGVKEEVKKREFLGYEVEWGRELADSYVREVELETVVVGVEKLKKELGFVWEKREIKRRRLGATTHPIARVIVVEGKWWYRRFEVDYKDEWEVEVKVYFQVDGEEKNTNFATTWGELPAWLRAELSSRYPVCSCGRQRRDIQVSDGYGKCELCRTEETCERCGKQAKITVINGRLVCENCRPYEEQEQLIATHLTMGYRQKIADEARKLLQGQALEAELGLAVLKAGLGYIPSDYTRDRILRRYEGYRWYYFTDEGVFGTKFEPGALQVLQYLPQATGNGLVELVAWVIEGPKAPSDFYIQSQVEGRQVTPALTEDLVIDLTQKIEAGEPVLAHRLQQMIRITFRQGVDPKGQPQLQAEGIFTGWVKNRKAESGFSEYTNQEVLFVCRKNCGWLEEQPQAGESWICEVGFQIGTDKRGRPVIVVNPQVRVDQEPEEKTG